MSATRTAAQRTADREALMRLVAAAGVIAAVEAERRTGNKHAGADLAALAKAGRLVRFIGKRYDSMTGYAANMFGGAGVMVRKEARYKLPEVVA